MASRLAAMKAGQASPEPSPAAQPAQPSNIFAAAAEEARLIAWPSPGGVARTTGVVLATMVVVTLVLLSVNALLASLSDKLFG